ncbi:hypothetical protein RDI58_029048 [Solanum bulbocastanum]|uniref:Uncharacterized protein n=1 Tax=Solanum bulbocastanum TaxID=147425 RepID=A0AAN8STD2_SOLBU
MLLPKRGISLDKFEEMLPTFYQRLLASGWICFAVEPCKANEQWVWEFYANLVENNIASRLITIQGKVVDYSPEVINRVYGILNHDIRAFTNKDYAVGAWLVSKIVACVLNDVLLNIIHLIVNEFWEFKMHETLSLVVLSLIMELSKWAEVEVISSDTLMEPKHFIFPLKMRGEGLVVKSKKMKIDSDKSVHVEDDSPIPPAVGLFEPLASELRVVQELVAKLPQGPGESSAGTRSYVPQSEFDAYLSDQGKQKYQLANLEKAYASLANSHGELSMSYGKMNKQEKSRYKFFTRMWKGVKGLWKVLKENDPLLITRPDDE